MGQVEREIDRYGLGDTWTRILGKIEREEAGKQGNKRRGSSNKGHLSGTYENLWQLKLHKVYMYDSHANEITK